MDLRLGSTVIIKANLNLSHLEFFLLENVPNSTLELVHIFFDTASYDEIERDKKIKFEGQLSLIGGTMGLLTGFSIISGVEILYFLAKFVTGWILAKIEALVGLRKMEQTAPPLSVENP